MLSLVSFLALAVLTLAAPAPAFNAELDARQVPSAYAPVKAACPATPLVRPATSISSSEAAYISARKINADIALRAFLRKTSPGFGTNGSLPNLALTTSGGGLRSLLTGAGVIQGFDSRDSATGVSGIYQALTYEAGLSGGGWLLSSLAGNNWPTVSSLLQNLWGPGFQDSLLVPGNVATAGVDYALVVNDIKAKNAAGFPPTLTDPYGRLLSYDLLYGADGGVADRLSGITTNSNFTAHSVPYPIITSIGVQEQSGQCTPSDSGTQYELHPYEFGSWDSGVAAFTQTAYLGSSLNNGAPTTAGSCIMNYDNLGYVLGTSSNLFNELCTAVPIPQNSSNNLANTLAGIVNSAHGVALRDEFAVYPNPFYGYSRSSLVSSQKSLYLVDGGESNQNDPIWPLIHPERNVSVIIVNDNSADTSANYPNGSEVYNTYVQARMQGLTRMPVIPQIIPDTGPKFFGCNSNSTVTIIYLPNQAYTFASGTSTFQVEYPEAESAALIANGQQVATKGGDATWPTCLACGIMKKSGQVLPAACTACFSTYCYN